MIMPEKLAYEKLEKRVLELEKVESDRKRAEEALETRIMALTRPFDDTGSITFGDLFNLDDIQRLQDEFSSATGVASIITHTDGTPITRPSNFCRLCNDIIRKTDKGRANCYESDAAIGRLSPDGPIIQPCMSGGLWDAGAAISVGGKHIANWLIGQVRDDTQTEEKIREYAREIEADEEIAIVAFREVPSMSRERFGQIAQVLFTLANQLSTTAYQNVQQARFIEERNQAEEEIRRHKNSLVKMVEERSIELRCANEQLQTELAERNRISSIFQARAQLFEYAGKHSLDELIEETLNAVERLTESQISFYHFVNPDQKSLTLQNWSTKTKSSSCSASGKRLHYEIAQAGVWVDCFHQRKPVIHNDYESLPHKKGLPPGHSIVVRELVVPVFRGNKIVAILGIGNKPIDYDQHDVQVVSMFADLAWDITEQKRGEERIRRLNETLEQRVADRTAELENRAQQLQQLALELTDAEDRERRRIASILHDDFQQELAYIKLDLGILQNKADLQTIQQRLKFLGQIIGECIEKSRNLSYEINPPALLQSGLIVALRVLAQNMKVRFGLNVTVQAQHNAEPDSIVLASILLRSVRELLFNVIKHAGVDSAIMDVRSNNGMIHIRIKDFGNGFVYDPGRPRLDRETGFGLCNIEDRITFLGGHMKIKTAPGKGCCIELTVPKDVSRKAGIPEPPSDVTSNQELVDIGPIQLPQSLDERRQIRILLADDHQMMREALAKLLKDCKGMTVVGQANDGLEAVRLAALLKPHVILMDLTMPVLDGFEATAQITKNNPDIRIIGLSVHNDVHTRQKMLHVGASAYLTKTGSPVTLVETIRNVYSGNMRIDLKSENTDS
jgi:signal transduction histidine kinase/ligand-binding sensor protein/ActR/RegA family two-component response regulator